MLLRIRCTLALLLVMCLGNMSCDKHERYGFVVVNMSGKEIPWVHLTCKGFQTDFGGIAHGIDKGQAPIPIAMPDEVTLILTMPNGKQMTSKAVLRGIVEPSLDGDVYLVIQPDYSIRVDWAKTGDIQKSVRIMRGE